MAGSKGIRAGKAFVELYVTDNKFTRGLRKAQRRLAGFGAGVGAMGRKLAMFGGIGVAAFGATAKAFGNFEEQMARVSTMLREPEKWMKSYTKAVRDMSIEFGQSTEVVADGLRKILSAQIAPEGALGFLRAASEAAIAGSTDVSNSVDALLNIINAYGLEAKDATDISNLLFRVIFKGRITYEELADSLGHVATMASAAGITLEETGATIATLTRNGLQSRRAMTAFKSALIAIVKGESLTGAKGPTAQMRELGMVLSEDTLKAKGFAGMMRELGDVNFGTLVKFFPKRSALGIVTISKHLEGFQEDLDDMADRADATNRKFAEMAAVVNHAWRQVKQAAMAAAVALGKALGPTLKKVAKNVREALAEVTAWIEANQELVLTVFSATVAVTGLGVALMAVAVPFTMAAMALGGLATTVGLLITLLGFLKAALIGTVSVLGAVKLAVILLKAAFVVLKVVVAATIITLGVLKAGVVILSAVVSASIVALALFKATFLTTSVSVWLLTGTLAVLKVGLLVLTGVLGILKVALAATWVVALGPIGLVLAGFAAVLAAVVLLSGAVKGLLGIFDNVGDTFSEFGEQAMAAFEIIKTALKSGDYKTAAKAMWAGIKMAWATGIAALEKMWANFKMGFVESGSEMRYAIKDILARARTGARRVVPFVDADPGRRDREIAAAAKEHTDTTEERRAAMYKAIDDELAERMAEYADELTEITNAMNADKMHDAMESLVGKIGDLADEYGVTAQHVKSAGSGIAGMLGLVAGPAGYGLLGGLAGLGELGADALAFMASKAAAAAPSAAPAMGALGGATTGMFNVQAAFGLGTTGQKRDELLALIARNTQDTVDNTEDMGVFE